VARYDQVQPHLSGFRARLNAAWLLADVGAIIPVSLNASGRVVKGASGDGICGIVVLGKIRPAGHQIDVMRQVELVDVSGLTGQAAGKKMYMSAAGVISADPAVLGAVGTNGFFLGQMVEADRLIVQLTIMQRA